MHILITGMNKNQCTFDFYTKQQLKVVPSHYSLIRCLQAMGHTVEQRAVMLGENLDKYDEVILFLHNPAGFANFLYNGLYVLSQRPNCIIAFDDWQIDPIYSGIFKLDTKEKLFRKYLKDSQEIKVDDIEKYETYFFDAIYKIRQKNNRILLSAFEGGDLSLLLDYDKDLLFSYNPNPYHLNRQPREVKEKQRIFNFAGLVQDKTKKWLEKQCVDITGWELKKYGSRKDGQDRVTEDVMVDLFAEHYGILMPGYYHSGSGWWRARPLQCADACSILIGDPKELMIYYNNERLSSYTATEICTLSDEVLWSIANDQRNALYYNHPLDKIKQQQELNKIL